MLIKWQQVQAGGGDAFSSRAQLCSALLLLKAECVLLIDLREALPISPWFKSSGV